MKCVYCKKNATYIIEGTSVCKEHTKLIPIICVPSYEEFKKSDLYKDMLEEGQ